jgi:hypothetical protein
MSTDCAAIDLLARQLRSGLRLLRLLGDGHKDSVLRILRELGERSAAERAVYASMLLQTLHGLHRDRGDVEVSAGLARVLSGAGDAALAAAASEWLARLGSPESSMARHLAAKLAELVAVYPELRAVAVGGVLALPVEGDALAGEPPAGVGKAHEFGPYVEEAVAVLAHDAGLEVTAYRAAVRALVEARLMIQAAAGRTRIVPCTEHGEVVLRGVVVVRDEVVDPAREVSLATLRAAGLDAPVGATVSLRVWVRRDPGGVKEVSAAFESAVSGLARHAMSRALDEPGPTPLERVAATHAPPGLALTPFHAMAVLRVVEVERDRAREITRARLAAELEIFDDVELGDEFLVFDPVESVALLGAAARAFWAEEAIVHLDGWMASHH